jgi:hypothetical protein
VCNNENDKRYNLKVYECIRENGGWDNWDMIMIEECLLDNIFQALAKERFWMEQLQATLNSRVPNRQQTEYNKIYREQNKDKIKEQLENYKETNRDKLNKYNQIYREENRDNKAKYREINREKLNEQNKLYYEKNKEIISNRDKQKYTCDCCSTCRFGDKSRHFKTIKHQKYIKIISHTYINGEQKEG